MKPTQYSPKGQLISDRNLREGDRWELQGMNMINIHYTHAWKCHNEIHYFGQLTYANKKDKRKKCDLNLKVLSISSLLLLKT